MSDEWNEAQASVDRLAGFHERAASSIPQIARGKVWCTTCGCEQSVRGADALRGGWPKHCGYTMTIDSPEERRSRQEHRER